MVEPVRLEPVMVEKVPASTFNEDTRIVEAVRLEPSMVEKTSLLTFKELP